MMGRLQLVLLEIPAWLQDRQHCRFFGPPEVFVALHVHFLQSIFLLFMVARR
jgi:hypothetical protein